MFLYGILFPNIDWEDLIQALNKPLKNQRGFLIAVVMKAIDFVSKPTNHVG
jgi:hypothetical protein